MDITQLLYVVFVNYITLTKDKVVFSVCAEPPIEIGKVLKKEVYNNKKAVVELTRCYEA